MEQNSMQYCVHCGAEVADNADICTTCGCQPKHPYALHLKRKSQIYLFNPPMHIHIAGNGQKKEIVLEDGEMITLSFPRGEYFIQIQGSFRKTQTTVRLERDTTLEIGWNRFSGKIETWTI